MSCPRCKDYKDKCPYCHARKEDGVEYAARLRELLNREKIPLHGRYIYDPRTGEVVYIK